MLEEAIARELAHQYGRQYMLEFLFDTFGDQAKPPTAQRVAKALVRETLHWSELIVVERGLLSAVARVFRKDLDKQRLSALLEQEYIRLYPAVQRKAEAIWDDPNILPEM